MEQSEPPPPTHDHDSWHMLPKLDPKEVKLDQCNCPGCDGCEPKYATSPHLKSVVALKCSETAVNKSKHYGPFRARCKNCTKTECYCRRCKGPAGIRDTVAEEIAASSGTPSISAGSSASVRTDLSREEVLQLLGELRSSRECLENMRWDLEQLRLYVHGVIGTMQDCHSETLAEIKEMLQVRRDHPPVVWSPLNPYAQGWDPQAPYVPAEQPAPTDWLGQEPPEEPAAEPGQLPHELPQQLQ